MCYFSYNNMYSMYINHILINMYVITHIMILASFICLNITEILIIYK